MATLHTSKPGSVFAPQYIHGVYIPSVLLVAGTALIKTEWILYAVLLAATLGGWKIYHNRNVSTFGIHHIIIVLTLYFCFRSQESSEARPVPGIRIEGEDDHLTQCCNVGPAQCRCLSMLLISCSYRFALPRPTDILGLPIGQHISLAATLPGQPKEVVRSYTPISSDDTPGYFDLLLKSYPTGNISKHMACMKIGETMKVKGPKGAMVYKPNMSRHLGMIAGGTGITPMLQIIRAIIRGRPRNGGNDKTEVDLIFANVNPEDILLKEDLDQLAKEDENFRVYYVLNNPPENWAGGVGFVTPEMIKVYISHSRALERGLGR